MSRLDGRPIVVEVDLDGAPVSFALPGGAPPQRVLALLNFWREWIGVLDGEPERDVWRVQTPRGICEIHRLRYQPTGEAAVGTPACRQADTPPETWLLHAWED